MTKVSIGRASQPAPPPPAESAPEIRKVGDIAIRTIDAEKGTLEVTDRKGRRIQVQRLSELERFDLFEAFGSTNPNSYTMAMAALAATVRMFTEQGGSDAIPFPRTTQAIRRTIQRLGDAGMDAVRAAFAPEEKPDTEDDEAGDAKPKPDPTVELAKN